MTEASTADVFRGLLRHRESPLANGLRLCILVVLALPDRNVGAAEYIQSVNNCDSSRSVNVSGTAVVNVTPDRALIQLGVQSNGPTPSDVKFLNTHTIEDVIDRIKSFGVDAKDIRTDRYIVMPVYDDYNSLHIKGYRIRQYQPGNDHPGTGIPNGGLVQPDRP